MSIVRDELRANMTGLSCSKDGRTTASFSFPLAFIGFDGHFPGKAIVPGICKIEASLVMLEALYKKKIELKEIVFAKYFLPILSDESVIFTCEEKTVGDDHIANINISNDDKKIAKIQLKIGIE